MFDAAIVGGGVMGCATALELAAGGMSVAVVERRALGVGASGVNAGTLSLQIKRAALVPYALKGLALWRTTSERFGVDVHYRQTGGLTVAFTEAEAEILTQRMGERKAAGVPLEIISGERARAIEPGLSAAVRVASWCAEDGYADSTATGRAYRKALLGAGVTLREGEEVTRIERHDGSFAIRTPKGSLEARRVVLAGGAWLGGIGRQLGVELPIHWRVNQVSVTERMARAVKVIVGHAYGLLTLKQSDNGTTLIGGGWQGKGDPEQGPVEIIPDNLVGNLRLALYAVPALRQTRVVRTWLGLEANVPDLMPLVGPVPGIENAFVIGAVRGGYTIGPYMGRLLGQSILGREPELPLFNPGRFNTVRAEDRAPA
ncbi:MAG: FAD-binding oxidoreductase [Proteobacteria bacterium]|nr:FAD-binding oxidoreductase [Pseudomonadota bacterium]